MKRILLDEGVFKGLAKRLRDMGLDAWAFPNDWKQLSNGRLLDEVERQGFQVLVTCDKNMQFQQNMTKRPLALLVLPTNLRAVVYALVDELVEAIGQARAGATLTIVSSHKRDK